MVQMQAANPGVVVLGATNTPFDLDQAIRRRFDKRIYVPLPDTGARAAMFRVHLGDTPHHLAASDFQALAQATEGFSGSDIAVIVKDVLFEPVRKTRAATHFRAVAAEDGEPRYEACSPGDSAAFCATLEALAESGVRASVVTPPVVRADFDKALARARATVSPEDLAEHERFTTQYGEEG
jgi:vacuolar protein-sorting-associated protein 4